MRSLRVAVNRVALELNMRDQTTTPRPPRWHNVIIALVCLGGVLLSGLVWAGMRAWDQEHLAVRLNQQAAEQAELLENQMLRSMEVLRSIGSLLATRGQVDRSIFHTFVQDALQRQPELQALGWTPVVPEVSGNSSNNQREPRDWRIFYSSRKTRPGTRCRSPIARTITPCCTSSRNNPTAWWRGMTWAPIRFAWRH